MFTTTSTALVGEQEHRREQRPLLGGEAGAVDRDAVAEDLERALERGDLAEQRLVALGARRWRSSRPSTDARSASTSSSSSVSRSLARIGVAGHRRVLERPQHVEDGVAVAERAEEPVAEPFAGARALDQRGDVDDLEARVHELLGMRHRTEAVDPLVGHVRDADRGLGGRERMRGDDGVGAGERVEQARLAAVREAHETQSFHGCRLPTHFGTPAPVH